MNKCQFMSVHWDINSLRREADGKPKGMEAKVVTGPNLSM